MKSFALALTFGAASALHGMEFEYMKYVAKFGKVLKTVEEFEQRLVHFIATHHMINEFNESESTTHAHNQFSDWSREEYSAMLGYIPSPSNAPVTILDETKNAGEVNWVTSGAVTDVKDQGVCGSCWAFSTTGSLEGRQQIANGTLISFSEQQLVDCAYGGSYGSYGCNGGSMYGAMTYYETYDAETEDTYPYISGSSTSRKSCQYSTSMDTDTAVTQPNAVTSNSVSQLKAAVSEGPVSVAIEADTYYFQTYSTGVMDNASSCGTNLDHGVLVVGYGTDAASGEEYWLVKNSWNTVWGDQGYFKLAIQDGSGMCGVQMQPVYPTTTQKPTN